MSRSSFWQTGRLALLAVVFIGVVGAIGKALLPTTSQPGTPKNEAVINLPEQAVLTGWQLVESNPLEVKDTAAGQRYRFQKNGTPLEIEVQYMAPFTDGNVTRFLFVYSPLRNVNASMQERFQPQVGHYGVLTYQGKAYLTACTTPQGPSTVTDQQFVQVRTQYDFRLGRLVAWVTSLGQQDLADRRCLWTLMSTPAKTSPNPEINQSDEDAYRLLEETWVTWHSWWQQNYPKR